MAASSIKPKRSNSPEAPGNRLHYGTRIFALFSRIVDALRYASMRSLYVAQP